MGLFFAIWDLFHLHREFGSFARSDTFRAATLQRKRSREWQAQFINLTRAADPIRFVHDDAREILGSIPKVSLTLPVAQDGHHIHHSQTYGFFVTIR